MLEALGGPGTADLLGGLLPCLGSSARPVRPALEALEVRVVPAYWIGPTGGDSFFGTAANWSDGIVPGDPGSNGYAEFFPFPGTNTDCIVNGVFNVDRVTMSAGYTATLTIPAGSALIASTLFDQHGTLSLTGGVADGGNYFYINGPVFAGPSAGGASAQLIAAAGLYLNGAITVTGGTVAAPGLVLDCDNIDAAHTLAVSPVFYPGPPAAFSGAVGIVGSYLGQSSSAITLNNYTHLVYTGTTAGSFFKEGGVLSMYGADITLTRAQDTLEVRDGGVLNSLAGGAGQDAIFGDVQIGPSIGTLNVGSAFGDTSELQFNTGSLEVQSTGVVNLYSESVLNFPAAAGVFSDVTIAGTLNMYHATLIAAPTRVAAVEVTGTLLSVDGFYGVNVITGNLNNDGHVELTGLLHGLSISGNYTQSEEGELVIQLDNPSGNNNGLFVGGVATLDGTLTLEALNPLTAGQTWTIIDNTFGPGIVGDFAVFNFPDDNPAWLGQTALGGFIYNVSN
ncbi:MAG: hypothetical protein L0Z62_47090 [Gemmataceae bacterium]|nr:hypothetical protein [Gemmataceae bacterium]